MILKIISWNVRGLNEVGKRLGVQNMLRGWRVDFVCLQETKLEVVSRAVVSSLWGDNTSVINFRDHQGL